MTVSIKDLKNFDRLYALGLSPISDLEYDNHKEQLQKKNPNDPYFKSVGTDSREKVKLPFILGSLNKTKANGTCEKWLKKQGDVVVVSPKLDGVSILVNYFNGEVDKAYLRGDGEFGQEITNKAKRFIKPITETKSIWTRGEVLLDYLPEGYKNKRNAVAGIINDEENELQKDLRPIFYEYLNSEFDYESERLTVLEFFGIPVVDRERYEVSELTENKLVEILKEQKEKNSDLLIDGLVITRDKSDRENVKYPDQKVAFKVNQEAIPTKVIDIKWNTSRKGRVIPLVYIEPTEIDGSTISKVTGHNAKYIIDEGINIGTTITVCFSGDVIPYIVDVVDGDKANSPESCTSCGGQLTMKGVDLVCTNKKCETQSIKALTHFIKTIGVMGMSKTTIEKLGINTIEELYSLSVQDIVKLDGFGIKKAEGIVNELKDKLTMMPDKFLSALGISGLGNTNSKRVLDAFENIGGVSDTINDIFEAKDFSFIEGIGDKTSDNIIDGLVQGLITYKILKDKGLKFEEKQEGSQFSGKIMTLTGTAPIKRDNLVRILESQGCVVKNISKKVDFLVTNDVESNSSKAKKARNYGIPFMSYDDLLDKLGVID